jgi:O-antigen ligase
MISNQFITAKNIISLMMMFFLIFGATIRGGAATIAFFLFLYSCIWLYRAKGEKSAKLDKAEKLWLWSVVLFNSVVLLSSYENFRVDFSAIDSLTRFLLIIPVYFLVRRIGINLSIFILGGAVGAIAVGFYAFYQMIVLGHSQATGMADHIYFGQLSLLLSFIAFYGFAFYQDKKYPKIFFLLSSFAGVYAVLASGSRGVWIALPAVVILIFKYSFPKISWVKKISALLAFGLIIFSVYATNTLNVQNRIDRVANETINFFEKGEVAGSAGLRLEMWRASLIMIKDSYGLGLGDKGYTKSMKILVAQKKVHPAVKNFDVEPHNYYLKTFVGQGIIGIILLFLILFIPMRNFYQHLKNTQQKAVQSSSILGVGIIICYLDFMLSNTTFDVQLMSVFFGLIVFSLYANVFFEKSQANLK